ncbi:Integrator complex subunit 8 [Nymphon striatum]|nr:Integrator complex subunit 8 [Nymphon striatum]
MLQPVVNIESSNKLVWFEFLLVPNLLYNHLNQEDADPSAADLIIQFLVNSSMKLNFGQNQQVNPQEALKCYFVFLDIKENGSHENHKSLSLKILAFKTFASVHWDLDFFESKLPLPMQQGLLSSFVELVFKDSGYVESIHNTEIDLLTLPSSVVFAISLYHRWPGQNDLTVFPPVVIDTVIAKVEENLQSSVAILERLLSTEFSFVMPTMNSFGNVTEETVIVVHSWDEGKEVHYSEFFAQTAYDLACFYFYQQRYELSHEKFKLIQKKLTEFQMSDFCKIDKEALNGYCVSCEGIFNKDFVPERLIDQINEATKTCSDNLIDLLKEDNQALSMSLSQRDKVETDLPRFNDRDLWLYFRVITCNVVRRVIEGEPVYLDYRHLLKNYAKQGGVNFFLQLLSDTLSNSNSSQKLHIKNYLKSLCFENANFYTQFTSVLSLRSLYSEQELDEIFFYSSNSCEVIESLNDAPAFNLYGNIKFEYGQLQNKLILSYELPEIQRLLDQFHKLGNTKSVREINRKWNLPLSLDNLLKGVHPRFMQNMAYVVLAKAGELRNIKKYSEARSMYRAVETELRNQNYQLSQMINWEVLLIDLLLFKKNEKDIDMRMLKQGVKNCISAAIQDRGTDLSPRPEIIENCSAFLLNIQDLEYFANLINGPAGYPEQFSKLLAAVYIEFKENAVKSSTHELWATVVPVFNASLYKRTHGGNIKESSRDNSHTILTKVGLMQFMEKILDTTVLSVLVSCFSKLFNLLKDNPTYNLQLEYEGLWPNSLQNSDSLSLSSVEENVKALLKHALTVQSNNPIWLRTTADLAYAHGYYSQSIKYYLKAGIVSSDYFSNSVPKQIWDEKVYNNLIRSCTHLHCYTQAAVFCQFHSKIDYGVAFKWLSERPCNDSCDSYYNCIWDITLLEYLINFHARCGETDKRQLALSAIGLLELNSNNHEEILRNAAQTRKTKFLIAMAKHYL